MPRLPVGESGSCFLVFGQPLIGWSAGRGNRESLAGNGRPPGAPALAVGRDPDHYSGWLRQPVLCETRLNNRQEVVAVGLADSVVAQLVDREPAERFAILQMLPLV